MKKYYDLSQPVYHNCVGWPTYKMTDIKYEANYAADQFNAERIDMNSHTGTHVDAPFHFFPDGKTVDEIPVERWQGEAVLIDLREKVGDRHGIVPEDLAEYDDLIKEDSIVLLNTGWCHKRKKWDKTYCNDWPYVTGELAEYFVKKKIKGCGIDCMSVGGWYEGTGRPCHEILLSNEIWALEEVFMPDELMNYKTCRLYAFPLKLQGFSGAPVRAVAEVDD